MATKHGEQQRERILHAIATLRRTNGYSPTVREIADEVGLSKTGTYTHLRMLQDRGLVFLPRRFAGWMLRS